MLSPELLANFNDQINKEIYSAYLYLAMASYAKSKGLEGIANWFNVQVREELAHARKLYEYVNAKEERVIFKTVDEPPQNFTSATDLFEKTLSHEKKVTKLIDNLINTAKMENDKAAEDFLQWFVKEQVEEESNAAAVLNKIKSADKDNEKLMIIDKELAKRTMD
ncbi:MAG: ferritin [Candidatus Omnitrophota bacterium]